MSVSQLGLAQADIQQQSMMQCVRKYGIVGLVLWDCSSKTAGFRRFTGTISTVSRVSN